VFFTPEELARFHAIVERFGASRDLEWISVDPLVPLGGAADRSVLDIPVPPGLVDRNRRQGLFGLIGPIQFQEANGRGHC
jgi:hypothetical protein